MRDAHITHHTITQNIIDHTTQHTHKQKHMCHKAHQVSSKPFTHNPLLPPLLCLQVCSCLPVPGRLSGGQQQISCWTCSSSTVTQKAWQNSLSCHSCCTPPLNTHPTAADPAAAAVNRVSMVQRRQHGSRLKFRVSGFCAGHLIRFQLHWRYPGWRR